MDGPVEPLPKPGSWDPASSPCPASWGAMLATRSARWRPASSRTCWSAWLPLLVAASATTVTCRGESGWSRTATQLPRTPSGRTAWPLRAPGSAPQTEGTSGETSSTVGAEVGSRPVRTLNS